MGLHPRIEELDLECVVGDRTALSDKLVEALPGHNTPPIGINIHATTVAKHRAIEGDAEPHRPVTWCGPESGAPAATSDRPMPRLTLRINFDQNRAIGQAKPLCLAVAGAICSHDRRTSPN